MNGQLWHDLMVAVKATINHILSTPTLKNSIKITVINYGSNARVIFEKMRPSLDLLEKIEIKGSSGTDFENALRVAYETILGSKDEFDKFTVGFLTDGRAHYPEKIIERINNDTEKIKHRINFNCVLFGKANSNLEDIAKNLNAKYEKAISSEDLKNSFKEIINISFK